MRSYYLMSTFITSTAFLIVMLFRFDDRMVSTWVIVAACAYQFLYGLTLVRAGYGWKDLLGIYSLNMVLVPINFAGNLLSLRQIFTGRKAAFTRTPKIAGRTAVPMSYIVAEYGLLLLCLASFTADFGGGRLYHMVFSILNGAAFLYCIHRFIGLRHSMEDILASLRSRQWWRASEARLARQKELGLDHRGLFEASVAAIDKPQTSKQRPNFPVRRQLLGGGRIENEAR
jgi:cellulose synthase (UDP-forming)